MDGVKPENPAHPFSGEVAAKACAAAAVAARGHIRGLCECVEATTRIQSRDSRRVVCTQLNGLMAANHHENHNIKKLRELALSDQFPWIPLVIQQVATAKARD